MDFLRLLAAGRCGALDTFFSSLTYFGSEIAFMAAALLIFWCVDKRQGYYVFLVGALGTVCNQFLKLADRKSTRLNSSHWNKSRMPSSA